MINEIKKRIKKFIEDLNNEVETLTDNPEYTELHRVVLEINKNHIVKGMLLTLKIIEEVENDSKTS